MRVCRVCACGRRRARAAAVVGEQQRARRERTARSLKACLFRLGLRSEQTAWAQWAEAEGACLVKGEGVQLASVTSAEQQQLQE